MVAKMKQALAMSVEMSVPWARTFGSKVKSKSAQMPAVAPKSFWPDAKMSSAVSRVKSMQAMRAGKRTRSPPLEKTKVRPSRKAFVVWEASWVGGSDG